MRILVLIQDTFVNCIFKDYRTRLSPKPVAPLKHCALLVYVYLSCRLGISSWLSQLGGGRGGKGNGGFPMERMDSSDFTETRDCFSLASFPQQSKEGERRSKDLGTRQPDAVRNNFFKLTLP